MNRSYAYWPTRIMLAIGVGVTALVILLAPLLIQQPPCMFCDTPPGPLGLPMNVVQAAVAVGLAVVGLVWMLRIFRGPRDEPPAWRYRR